ncbi:uncharacterized protein LOC113319007 [Papaver somniferum]|nr:uncharacterized protein LOC113319007 [Papaver somniferum]
MHENNLYSSTCEPGRRNNLNISCIDDSTQGLQPAVSQVVTVPNENERSDKHVDYKCEMFVFPDELNSEYSVSYPIAENVNPYSPILEAAVWTENTNGFDKVGFSCICDDDDDTMLEEVVNSQNEISESCISEMLDHNVETYVDNVSSNVDIHRNGADLGLVQLFCERENGRQLVSDLEKAKFAVDNDVLMHKNKFNMSDAMPRSQHDASYDLSMHENKSFDDYSESGLVNLFNDCEHDRALIASDWGGTRLRGDIFEPKNEYNLGTSIFLLKVAN